MNYKGQVPHMDDQETVKKPSSQLTGNAGLYHVAAILARRGWHAMPTIRNARGSDLVVGSSGKYFGVQSKALAKKANVFLGGSLEKLEFRMVDRHH